MIKFVGFDGAIASALDFLANIRYSVRSFARTPSLALALIFSIALGLGSNAVLYGFVRGLISATLENAGTVGVGETRVEMGTTPGVADALARVGALLRVAAAAVLLIACMNVAAFLIARASARARETSVRVALGASRARLAGLVLSDAFVITIGGSAAGLVLATWTANILPALFFSEDAEHLVYAPDLAAIAISATVGVVITIACGLLPLVEMRDDRPATVLQRESAGSSTKTRRLRAGLVIVQMSCCSALVVSTALLLQSFRSAMETSTGERLRETLLATLQVRPESTSRHEILALGLKYFRESESAARSVPGVTSTAWVTTIPGGAPTLQSLRIEQAHTPFIDATINSAPFTPDTLKLVSMPPVAGRVFGGQDTRETCPVVVINQEAADGSFGDDAVGRAIEDRTGRRMEIVGVVAMRSDADSLPTHRPTIFYYPQQGEALADRRGIRVPDAQTASTPVTLETNIVSRSFFEMMDSAVTAGRLFSDDVPASACGVGIVNQEAAARYFGGEAVGASVIDATGRRTEIVGVVQAPRLLALQREVEPVMYVPMTQNHLPRMAMLIRTAQADRATLTLVRRRLERVRGAFRPPAVVMLEQHLNRTALAPLRIATVFISASAAMALALGIMGLYGSMAEAARQRRRETALRVALGAQAWRVRREVFATGARLAGGGLVIGILGALASSRMLARISPSATPLNAWAWVAAPLLLMASVAIAGLLPARRALMADPLKTLRGD